MKSDQPLLQTLSLLVLASIGAGYRPNRLGAFVWLAAAADGLVGKVRASHAARATCQPLPSLSATTCCCATSHLWCLVANRCLLANLCTVDNLCLLANLSKVSTSTTVSVVDGLDLVANSRYRRFAYLTMTSLFARSLRLAASARRLAGALRLPASLCSNFLGDLRLVACSNRLGALRIVACANLLVALRIVASIVLDC